LTVHKARRICAAKLDRVDQESLPMLTGSPASYLLSFIALAVVTAWAIAAVFLRGEDLSAFDRPSGERFSSGPEPSAELKTIVASLSGVGDALKGVPHKRRVAALRAYIDMAFADRKFNASFTAVDCAGVRGEWVLAGGADSGRRTLYIHGGGFVIGSPRSHRTLTSRFSELTGGAVLAVDYRLMPEHSRRAGIEDCRAAYRWMLEHGPNGREPAHSVFVAGESAGGNLVLSLIAWLRDQGIRSPEAAVALCPLTDSTFASPSLKTNLRSDAMLGPLLKPLTRLPRWLLLWFGWIVNRINPRDPLVSPVYGDLSNLPPLLVQASEAEMLLDDSRRYVNRARAAGSPASLQTWSHVVHAWHIFNPELTEAREALEEIGSFLATASPLSGGAR
jgi:epsilon-lactone hydrolase